MNSEVGVNRGEMFHLFGGWFFHRDKDGSVLIEQRAEPKEGSPIVAGIKMSADDWVSIVDHIGINVPEKKAKAEIFIKQECAIARKDGKDLTQVELERLALAMNDFVESLGLELSGRWFLFRVNDEGYEEPLSEHLDLTTQSGLLPPGY